MLTASQKPRSQLLSIRQRRSIYGLVIAIFLAVILLEYTTPSAYVFGYLYTGAIVLTYRYLGRHQVLGVTLLAAALTLFNLVFPSVELRNLPTLANRLIAVAALLITGYLTERNRFYESEITQQRAHIRTQAQLAELREDFVSTLTHDLKTPLLGAIETVKSFQAEQFGQISEHQRQVLAIMTRSHDDTLQLVETMLDVYRNDAGGLVLTLALVDLRALLTRIITTLEPLAQSRQVSINLTSKQPHAWVCGDEQQLRRVFENLLANAISHTSTGTKVNAILQVTTESNCYSYRIQIQDCGPGIAAKELPHLFVRFYQSHSTRQNKGYGLGLYLSRQIIEAHSGKIWAESPASQGATFYCSLPANVHHESCKPIRNSTPTNSDS